MGVVGHLEIGDNTKVAAKAGISKDVPPNSIMAGMVGLPVREWRRAEVASRRLPELQKRVTFLEKKLKELEQNTRR